MWKREIYGQVKNLHTLPMVMGIDGFSQSGKFVKKKKKKNGGCFREKRCHVP